MTLLLRAIVAAPDARVADACGLLAISAERVAALASPWDITQAASEVHLLEHHRIVQALFEQVPCLPARFGGVFRDESAIRERLAERQEGLAAQLDRLGRRCELAITCAWRDKGATVTPANTPVGSGRAYLLRGADRSRALQTRVRRAEEIAARLLEYLAVEPGFVRTDTCPRPAVAVSMSVLVTRDQIDEISSRLERLGAQLPDVTMVVQGPWAPYTFAVSE